MIQITDYDIHRLLTFGTRRANVHMRDFAQALQEEREAHVLAKARIAELERWLDAVIDERDAARAGGRECSVD